MHFGNAVVCLVVVVGLALSVGAKAETETDSSAEMSEIKKLGDSELEEWSVTYLAQMENGLNEVLRHSKEAREQKDIIRTNCLNEKLNLLKGLLRIAKDASVALKEANARGERASAEHEYHKLTISNKKIRQLVTEARQCAGELSLVEGETKVVVEKDPNLVSDNDPTEEPPFKETSIEKPPAVSPFQ